MAHHAQTIAAMSSGAQQQQQQQQQQQEQRQAAGSSVKAAAPLLRSARPRSPGAADPPGGARGAGPRTRLVGAVAAVVVLALVAGLGAGLGLRGQARRAAPQFAYAPLVVGSTSGSIDVQLALRKEGVVHYVVVPTAQPTYAVDGASVVAASHGMLGGSALEVSPSAFSIKGLRCWLHWDGFPTARPPCHSSPSPLPTPFVTFAARAPPFINRVLRWRAVSCQSPRQVQTGRFRSLATQAHRSACSSLPRAQPSLSAALGARLCWQRRRTRCCSPQLQSARFQVAWHSCR